MIFQSNRRPIEDQFEGKQGSKRAKFLLKEIFLKVLDIFLHPKVNAQDPSYYARAQYPSKYAKVATLRTAMRLFTRNTDAYFSVPKN